MPAHPVKTRRKHYYQKTFIVRKGRAYRVTDDRRKFVLPTAQNVITILKPSKELIIRHSQALSRLPFVPKKGIAGRGLAAFPEPDPQAEPSNSEQHRRPDPNVGRDGCWFREPQYDARPR
jgi:hypothetical protein